MAIDDVLESFNFPIGQDDNINKEIIRKLFDLKIPKELNLKTELSDRELKTITKIEILNQIFNNHKATKNLLEEFKQLRVSSGRKGRTELITALNFQQEERRQDRLKTMQRALGIDR